MTDFSMELNADILRAALVCTSREETRYYLKGVSIEPNPRDLRVVSTDGHRLFCARLDVSVNAERFLIPKDALAKALKGYKFPMLIVSREGNLWRAGDIVFTPIDGVFPESWPRIMPSDFPPEPVHAVFNPEYLVDMVKIAVALDGKGAFPTIHANGQNPALVTFGERDDCCAVVMPRRDPNTKTPQSLRALVHSLVTIPAQA
jgi:hypothetical protein